MLLNSF